MPMKKNLRPAPEKQLENAHDGSTDGIKQEKFENFSQIAKACRKNIISMLTAAKSSHLGCSFSIIDILVVLYHGILDTQAIKNNSPERDYFILSKGHAAAGLYAALASVNLISHEILSTFYQNNSALCGHPMRHTIPGVEASTGSLGHGLSMGVGVALASKHDNLTRKVYVLVGDGECQEGSIWEAITMATRFKLDNLIIIVDYNNLQGLDRTDDIMPNLAEKFIAFGCHVKFIDGHNYHDIYESLHEENISHKPLVIIAKTIKGHGISFIQDKLEWHYRSFNPEQLTQAQKELESPLETSLRDPRGDGK